MKWSVSGMRARLVCCRSSSRSSSPPAHASSSAVASPSAEAAAQDVFDASDDGFKNLSTKELAQMPFDVVDERKSTYNCDTIHDGHQEGADRADDSVEARRDCGNDRSLRDNEACQRSSTSTTRQKSKRTIVG